MPVSHLQVSATLLEALSQHGDHVFVVVQQLLHQFTVTRLLVLLLDLQKETTFIFHNYKIKAPPTSCFRTQCSESDVIQLKCISSFQLLDAVASPQ